MICVCKGCGEEKTHFGKGFCKRCYEKQRIKNRFFMCPSCKTTKKYIGRSVCSNCYYKTYKRKTIICLNCKEKRFHHAKQLCDTCYEKAFKRKKELCHICNKIKELHTKHLCKNCYKNLLNKTIAQKIKNKARRKAFNNLKNSPLACERCKKLTKKLSRHHPDYSKPLEIMWLCKKCHIIEDKKIKNVNNKKVLV